MTSKKKCAKKPEPWHLELVEGAPSFWAGKTLWHVNVVGGNGEIVFSRETSSKASAVACIKHTAEQSGWKIKETPAVVVR